MEKLKKGELRNILLSIIGVAGVITLATLAPNAVQLLNSPLLGRPLNRKHKRYPSYVTTKVKNLVTQGLVKIENNRGQVVIKITPQGEKWLEHYRLEENYKKSQKIRKWDRKWRVIIFDIKEYRRRTRDLLRQELSHFGFQRLQNSVWLSPWPCEELIVLLKADLQIGKDLLYMLVDTIEGEGKLKKQFSLED